MSNEKSNIEHLRDIINKEMFIKEEALEFLDSIEDGIGKLINSIDVLKDELTEAENEETNLGGDVIDCGIGTIEYVADNLQLQLLMENLEERIKSQGALSILRKLQMPLPTT